LDDKSHTDTKIILKEDGSKQQIKPVPVK